MEGNIPKNKLIDDATYPQLERKNTFFAGKNVFDTTAQDPSIILRNRNEVPVNMPVGSLFPYDGKLYYSGAGGTAEPLATGLLEERISDLENSIFKIAYYAEITTTSGTISKPTGSTIILDQWSVGVDAIISEIPGGTGTKPDFEGTDVDVSSFDIDGNFTLSAALPSNPSALIYYILIPLKDYGNLDTEFIIEQAEVKDLINPVDFLKYNTSYVHIGSEDIGTTFWSDDTLSVKLSNNVTGQIFKEQYLEARNNTGATLLNGHVAMFTGTLGSSGKITTAYGIADSSVPAIYNVGLFTEDIGNNSEGFITTFGNVNDINTNGSIFGETWNDGDVLYVSPTTPGHLTNIMPNAPNLVIFIAAVIYAHATQGILLIRPNYRGKLEDLDDVNGTALTTTGQIPIWNDTNKYFDFNEDIYNLSKTNIGDVPGGNYLNVKPNGEIRLYGEATQWDDLRFPLLSTKAGGSKIPGATIVFTNGAGSQGVLAYAFNPNNEEELYFVAQMPHAWKQGSNIEAHMHWLVKTDGAAGQDVCWGLEYTWSNIAEIFSNTTIIYGDTNHLNEDLITNKQYLTELGEIDATGKTFSSILICRVFRDATGSGGVDDYPNDAIGLEIDFHYQLDSLGSNEEYVKY